MTLPKTTMRSLTVRPYFLQTGSVLVLPWLARSQGARTPPNRLPAPLPSVEGRCLTEEELRAPSVDWGYGVERVPLAVLRPGQSKMSCASSGTRQSKHPSRRRSAPTSASSPSRT